MTRGLLGSKDMQVPLYLSSALKYEDFTSLLCEVQKHWLPLMAANNTSINHHHTTLYKFYYKNVRLRYVCIASLRVCLQVLQVSPNWEPQAPKERMVSQDHQGSLDLLDSQAKLDHRVCVIAVEAATEFPSKQVSLYELVKISNCAP